MKVIFLDIDGVLNNEIWYLETRKNNPEKYKFKKHIHSQFDPRCIKLLNSITDKTNAKIVVSSTWRVGRTVEDLQELFKDVGITGEVIDKTDKLYFHNSSESVPRGFEIKKWIEDNKGILGTNLLNWKSYVILDDDGDMMYWQRNNFYQTDAYSGLTPNLAYRIINFLK